MDNNNKENDKNTKKINNKIINVPIVDEIKTSFLDYAMSVLVARALPDIRDGLKPVHRRIIYAMNNLGIFNNTPYKKSARIVGEVIGKYHPHGDSSVYDAMVRMAQDFSYRYPLIQGQGNFGSLDGDSPAAMRYTESRLSQISKLLIEDLKKDTVDFIDNYDSTEIEPKFLPAKIPNLLINGSYGIAVALATNIPPHNLGEVIDAIVAMIKNPEISVLDLMQYIKGPDFPTGALINTKDGLFKAYNTGNGTIIIRSKTEILKNQIIITEIPYQVNKAKLLEHIVELIKSKKINDITELRDESNREGVRIVIDLKYRSQPEIILNKLFKLTALQSRYSINMVCIVNGNQPKLLGLKPILNYFIKHRINIIIRRTKFELKNNLEKLHLLLGLKIALNNIEEIIKIIRSSKNIKDSFNSIKEKFNNLENKQIKTILDMKLSRLNMLEKDKIDKEIAVLEKINEKLKEIIENKDIQNKVLIDEQLKIKEKYNNVRRSKIFYENTNINIESLIKKEETFIVFSKNGYIKRVDEKEFKNQNRGGKGKIISDKSFIMDKIISANTLDDLLFFTTKGVVYKIKTYQLPKFEFRSAKGIPLVNLLKLSKEDKIATIIPIKKSDYNLNILILSKKGFVVKKSLDFFKKIFINGKNVMKIKNNDIVLDTILTNGNNNVMFISKNGFLCYCNESSIRKTKNHATQGVKTMKLRQDDELIGLSSNLRSDVILFVTENGYGKRTLVNNFTLRKNRASYGVKAINLDDKTGKLKYFTDICNTEDLFLLSKKSKLIRINAKNISLLGRTAQGNILMRLNQNDKIQSAETILFNEDNEDIK